MAEPKRGELQDWQEAIELAYLWSGYWEDEPAVHLDCGKVGFLARSFVYAMCHFGVIAKPSEARLSAANEQADG